MWDCIGSLLFLIWMIVLSYFFGYSIRKEQNFSKNLLTGYIGYAFILAIGLMIIELLELPWKLALIYFILAIAGILLYIIYSMKKNSLKLTKSDFRQLFKDNIVLLAVVIILMLISFISFNIYWLNNQLDDGYYLSKIVKMPYLDTPFSYNYVVNCKANSSIAYKINTWELEASIYVYLLKINVFTFCRLGLNFFNYLLLCSSISLFSNKIADKLQLENRIYKFIQFIPIVVILFATNMNTVYEQGFMYLVDHWQFVTAMYLGSSIPRTMGILWIVMSFIDNKNITIKDIMQLFIISVVLMSKSTIALPIIILTSVALFFVINFKKDKKTLWLLLPLFLYIIIGIVLPNNLDMQHAIRDYVKRNIMTLPFIVSSFIFLISFAFKKTIINRINIVLLIIFTLMLVPEVNDVFETFSVYGFVANRMLTTLLYTYYITTFAYVLFAFLTYSKERILIPILLIVTCVFTGSCVSTYTGKNISVKHSFGVIARNYRMVPNSTLELGRVLDEISKEKGTLRVLSPEIVITNKVPHPLATILTTVTENAISYSAVPRYPVDSDEKIASFLYDYQLAFHDLNNTKSMEAFDHCLPFIDKYKINCFILSGGMNEYESYGDFVRVRVVTDPSAEVCYSIYVKA